MIKTWNLDGEMISEIKAHDSYISDIAFANGILVSSNGNKTVNVWKMTGLK